MRLLKPFFNQSSIHCILISLATGNSYSSLSKSVVKGLFDLAKISVSYNTTVPIKSVDTHGALNELWHDEY
jgi:hypothetical protein